MDEYMNNKTLSEARLAVEQRGPIGDRHHFLPGPRQEHPNGFTTDYQCAADGDAWPCDTAMALALSDAWSKALRTAMSTVCRCSPVQGQSHSDHCPVWRHGFTAARELLGWER